MSDPGASSDSDPGKPLILNHVLNEVKAMKPLSLSESEPEIWQRTVANVIRSVVSIRFSHPCSFDTGLSLTSEATGFVVDAERGYILTNRHVVGPGPFWGSAIFHNQEEVDAYPVYRDPVHDFGILRFDPRAVKYMDVTSLILRPDLAKVGVEIRVIGNDAGEKLSILSGFISRLDRNAPKYKGYRDYNTCYYQANAAASGGSSGSPVVNIDGHAIALQAGGRSDGASTDYFLPLDRPLRALQLIQQGKRVSRGDIQCKFLLNPFDECRRLGLSAHWEQLIRATFPEENNMLVAATALPEGPSDQKISEGDILIKVNGELLTQFVRLDGILDANIGKSVRFLLQRGGTDVEVDIQVGDLDNITPDRFVAVAGASFHNLSYQLAQRFAIACRGVHVSEDGTLDFPKRSGLVIQTVDHKPTPDLDAFVEVVRAIPDKARIAVCYRDLSDLHTLMTAVVPINRHWSSKMKMITRNDVTGVWDFATISEALPPTPPQLAKATFSELKHIPHRAVAEIVRSFVRVSCTMPFLLDGCLGREDSGMGLVIDAGKGLVLVSREVVPHWLCDISITIADSICVDGKVVFLHPSHFYAIVQYDPAFVDAPVATASLSAEAISQGTSTMLVGYTDDNSMVYASTVVTETAPIAVPLEDTPRPRPLNVEAISVDTTLGKQCESGVLMTAEGTVQGVWLEYEAKNKFYEFGLATAALLPVVTQLRQGVVPKVRVLPAEFEAITMFKARVLGVSDEWIEKTETTASHHQLLMVKRAFGRGPDALVEGDVLVTLNGKIITKPAELDVTHWHDTLDAVVFRGGEELSLRPETIAGEDMETDHVVRLCGSTLQCPHAGVRQKIKDLPSEVYVNSRSYGAPSYQYGLDVTNFITHVNDIPTPSLDALLSVVAEVPDNTYFRIKGVSIDRIPYVITIKKNERYYPTVEWLRDPTKPYGWRRRTYEDGCVIEGEGTYGL